MMTEGDWLTELVTVGLEQTTLHGMSALTRVVADAMDAAGAGIWELTPEDAASPNVPSLLAAWFREAIGTAGLEEIDPPTADLIRPSQLTGYGSLRPQENSGGGSISDLGWMSIPLVFLDNSRGALTIYRSGGVAPDAIALANTLADVLPWLCHTIRDRQALNLVRECNDALRGAYLDSPDGQLTSVALRGHLECLCERVRAALRCIDVAVFLEDPVQAQGVALLAARASLREVSQEVEAVRPFEGVSGWAYATKTSVAVPDLNDSVRNPLGFYGQYQGLTEPQPFGSKEVDLMLASTSPGPRRYHPTLMVIPIMTGDSAWGVIRCSGVVAPPYRLTQRDVSTVEPVAAQVAQYYRNWLGRRELLEENESWRRLASGITSLDQLLHTELSKASPDSSRIYRTASAIVADVVAGVDDVVVRAAGALADDGPDTRTVEVSDTIGIGRKLPQPARSHPTLEPIAQLASEQRADQSYHGSYSTPIKARGRTFGFLDTYWTTETHPRNLPQVSTIISDQLGLYHYLQGTIGDLRSAKEELKETVRSQTRAFEDLEHQLVGPLNAATTRANRELEDRELQRSRFDARTESSLRAIRGLCRKANRVARSAGVFAILAKGEQPPARPEPVSPGELVSSLIAAASDAELLVSHRRHIRVHVERGSFEGLDRRLLWADRAYLDQCVGNILDNATKYSYEDEEVTISGVTDASHFSLLFKSRGIPMSPTDVANCTQRRWRGSQAKLTTGEGSGLGLWIVDNLTRAMRGELHVVGDGDITTVQLVLPIMNSTAR